METDDTQRDPADPSAESQAYCRERRKTNRLWACKVARRNKELDASPNQCSVTNAYARGSYRLLTMLAPDCAACRYR